MRNKLLCEFNKACNADIDITLDINSPEVCRLRVLWRELQPWIKDKVEHIALEKKYHNFLLERNIPTPGLGPGWLNPSYPLTQGGNTYDKKEK